MKGVSLKLIGIIVAIGLGAGLLLMDQPSLEDKVKTRADELNKKIEAREVQIDPAELLDLIYNNSMALRIIDVRDESDFNLFHIADSWHVTMDQVKDPLWVKKLPKQTVFVIVSNDEAKAVEAWKLLSVQNAPNLYVLAGGINLWIEVYGNHKMDATAKDVLAKAGDKKGEMRHEFDMALGGRHPASDPDPHHLPKREYTAKVKNIGSGVKKVGGCG